MLIAMRTPLLIVLCSACSGGLGGGTDAGNVVEIALHPSEVALVTSADATSTKQFTVTATFQNGQTQDNFDLVAWSLSNTAVGSVDDGLFTTSTSSGGETWLTAEVNGVSATAAITVTFVEEKLDDGIPDSAEDAFDGDPEDASTQLTWVYPEDSVALPRNLPEFSFMWGDSLGGDLYQLTFTSATTNVKIITDHRKYTVPEDLWKVITATNAGSDVTVSLYGIQATVSESGVTNVERLYKASDITFRVNRFDAQGAVYYWSVTKNGIMRSEVDEADPELWFGRSNGTTEYCVGCHVISPDGERVAYSWQIEGEEFFRMGLGAIGDDATPEELVEMDTSRDKAAFSTWSPDGDRVVYSYNGTLYLYDGYTGELLGEIESDLKLTQPSWSPDGDALVAVSATRFFGNDSAFNGGELVVFDIDEAGEFSAEPWVLVPSAGDTNQYYPAYSPDGEWVVFNRSTGQSYFDEDAALWIVDADGGSPIELASANRGANLTNSWPRWGPIPDDDVLWLAFASTRDYGSEAQEGDAHVWVSAIDTKLAEDGLDPSYPAFWLVQQELGGGNHAPWWSLY